MSTVSGFPMLPSITWPNTFKPFRLYCQKVLPAVYDDSLSYYELICKVAYYLGEVLESLNTVNDDIQEIYAYLEEVQAWIEAHEQYERRLDRLEEMMQALAQNALVYDVTTGLYRPSMATSRRMWQAGHPCGMTVEDLSGYTVDEAANLNVLHVSIDGRAEYMEISEYYGEIPMQYGYSVPCFIPDDYIKKSDLTYIDSDNLQERIIMGVLEKDAQTDLIEPTPYARRYTAYDLNNTWVLYNDHLVTDQDNDCTEGD